MNKNSSCSLQSTQDNQVTCLACYPYLILSTTKASVIWFNPFVLRTTPPTLLNNTRDIKGSMDSLKAHLCKLVKVALELRCCS